ncbi:MAG: hypothetical protein AAF501_10950 [Pseudomonadota bacterium]
MAETETGAMWRGLNWVWRMRERWVALVFVLSAVLWVEGTVQTFLDMPQTLDRQSTRVVDLEERVGELELVLRNRACGWLPCIGQRARFTR